MTTNLRSAFGTFSHRLASDTRGVTLVLVALAVSALIGFTGLGVETGLWYSIKRYNQSAADIAALSGAMELAGGQPYSDICKLAGRAAQANGFAAFAPSTCSSGCSSPPSGSNNCVNNPPVLGAYGGNANMVEVILAQQQNAVFASLFLPSVTIDTRAVAGLQAFPSCMIALNTSGQDLLVNGGGSAAANLNIPACSFISNSTSSDSIRVTGNSTITAKAIDTAGGSKVSGTANSISPPITTFAPQVADPYLGQITPTWPWPGGTNLGCTTGGATLQPGWYGGSCAKGSTPPMSFSSGTTFLCPGVYYLDGDDNQGEALAISGNAVVKVGTTGNGCATNGGVTIIAGCSGTGCKSGGAFDICKTASGSCAPTVQLSAPSTIPGSGIPKDILFYQPGAIADTSKGDSTIAGGSGVTLNGVIYTPATALNLNGNSTSFGNCTELIAASFSISGTPSMNSAPSCGAVTQSATTIVLLE
jgi:Flp pilus assembly protein TadG